MEEACSLRTKCQVVFGDTRRSGIGLRKRARCSVVAAVIGYAEWLET